MNKGNKLFYGWWMVIITNSITLTWTAPGDNGNQGTAKQYDIRYLEGTQITEANWATAIQATGEPAPKPAGSSENFAINGLQSGKTYYFAMKTADKVPNWSALSNVAIGTTQYMFQDPKRGTKLFVNVGSHKFRFTAPDGYDSGQVEAGGWTTTGGLLFAWGSTQDINSQTIYFTASFTKDYCEGKAIVPVKQIPFIRNHIISDPPGFE